MTTVPIADERLEVAQAMVRDLQERLADAERRIETLGRLMVIKTNQIDAMYQRLTLLRAAAQGWVRHTGEDACLDSETNSGSRDLGCPVCRLLLEDDPPEIVATARRSRA